MTDAPASMRDRLARTLHPFGYDNFPEMRADLYAKVDSLLTEMENPSEGVCKAADTYGTGPDAEWGIRASEAGDAFTKMIRAIKEGK